GPWNVVALGGYSVLTQSFAVDTDFTPVPALNGTDADKTPTTTFELRGERPHLAGLFGLKDLFGLDLGESDLLVGVFAQRREITDSNMRFVFNDVPFLGLQAVTLATSTASQAGLPSLGLPTIGII